MLEWNMLELRKELQENPIAWNIQIQLGVEEPIWMYISLSEASVEVFVWIVVVVREANNKYSGTILRGEAKVSRLL